jgi:hypothetical protein
MASLSLLWFALAVRGSGPQVHIPSPEPGMSHAVLYLLWDQTERQGVAHVCVPLAMQFRQG